MSKKNKFARIVLGTMFAGCFAAAAAFSLAGCDDKPAEESSNDDIYAVYQLYVAYAEEKGDEPLTYEEWLESVKGPQGEKGDKGDPGEDGADGAPGKDGQDGADGAPGQDGEDGKDGSAWLVGSGAPAATAGKEGDMYLDTATYDIYQKAASGWTKVGNIKGADGEDGQDGTGTGTPGQDGQDGQDGEDGADGATWITGTAAPAAEVGKVGDLYLDKTTFNVYEKTAEGWQLIGCIKGEQGEQGQPGQDGNDGQDGAPGQDGADGENGQDGEDGSAWLVGSGAPAATAGKEGDMYLDTATYDIYQKAASGWTKVGNIKGADGEDGQDGTGTGTPGQPGQDGQDGEDGADGATWITGTSAPAAEVGKVGDLYLDKTTFNVYEKTAEGWQLIGCIKGEQGEQGQPGQDGNDGQDGVPGQDGEDGKGIDSVTINEKGELVITYTDGTSVTVGKVTGEDGQPGQDGQDGQDGAPGQDGEDGTKWYFEKGSPYEGEYNLGDIWFDIDAYDIYRYDEGGWTFVCNIKTPAEQPDPEPEVKIDYIQYNGSTEFEAVTEEGYWPDMPLEVHYSDGYVDCVQITPDMFMSDVPDFTQADSKWECIVEYNGVQIQFTVYIRPAYEEGQIMEIRPNKNPMYAEISAENVPPEIGFMVDRYIEGGSSSEWVMADDSMLAWEGEPDFTQTGTYTATITYQGFTCQVNVVVYDPAEGVPVVQVVLSDWLYYTPIGGGLPEIYLNVEYADGSSAEIAVTEEMISYEKGEPDFTQTGRYTATITYQGFTENVEVQVYDPADPPAISIECNSAVPVDDTGAWPELYATIKYVDGTSEKVLITEDMVPDDAVNITVEGVYPISVIYEDNYFNFELVVYDPANVRCDRAYLNENVNATYRIGDDIEAFLAENYVGKSLVVTMYNSVLRWTWEEEVVITREMIDATNLSNADVSNRNANISITYTHEQFGMVTCYITVSLTMDFEGVDIVEQYGVADELTMFSNVETVTFYANGYVQFDDMYIYHYTYSEQYGYYVITDMASDMLVAVNDEGLLSHYIPEGTPAVYVGEIPGSAGMQGLRFEVYEEAIVMYTDMPDGQGGMMEDVLYMVLHNTIADGKLELMGITFTLTEPAEGEEYGTITVEGIPGSDDQPVVESVAGHTFAYEKGYSDDENVDEEPL